MVDAGYNIGARNQHADSGAYEFHIHRAYIIYGPSVYMLFEALTHSIKSPPVYLWCCCIINMAAGCGSCFDR